MIDLDAAQMIATEHLQRMQDRTGVALAIVDRLDKEYGWVFFYESRAYLEDGDASAILAGNSPFIVDAEDGAIHVLGTAHPVEDYLEQFERSLRK